ncbi:MAG: threonine--tRNA ligase [Candidatus Hydrogenedentes bacterium]|nr:threonine--tRNA ligase [Candidatus Hydrogenedentota bacterium]
MAAVDPKKQTPIYRLRHSLAHIMAQAVLELRPDAKLAFGPPVDFGFYYDFDFGDTPIGEADLEEIENRMRRIIKERQEFQQEFRPLDEALALLEEGGQHYKVEYAKELAETGKAGDEGIGFYINGPFRDMCEGPHLEHTGEVPKACFKLDRISGSYWRGDEKRPMLTRIYGLAFESKADLKDYIERRELARQRDHRKLGEELDLFLMDQEVGVGLPMWMPNGAVIRDELEKWAREEEFKAGYQRVSTPAITRSALYYKSGHLPYYSDSMYPPMTVDENDEYYLRPMNCPHHHKIYAARMHSYRELPFRLAEYGNTYRYEKHGSLAGLLRVRAMCMNDAHVYCTPEQVEQEFRAIIAMYRMYYTHLRMGNFRVRLSLHDSDSEKFVGQEEEWLRSEQIVRDVLHNMGIEFEEEAGEAAFYGPKVDIQVKNLLGREETVSTCQLDFVMPERFDLKYIDANGQEKRPYIIHRAPLSTHERMISFLIEFYGGAFPTWMAPVQVQLVPVNDTVLDYANKIAHDLRQNLFRAQVDVSDESFNKKIRNAVTHKIPNIWIIGNKEAENGSITWRRYASKDQKTVLLADAQAALETMRSERTMDNFEDVALPV